MTRVAALLLALSLCGCAGARCRCVHGPTLLPRDDYDAPPMRLRVDFDEPPDTLFFDGDTALVWPWST